MKRLSPALALLLVASLAACTSKDASPSPEETATGPRYVALGDSFTAGPQLAQTDTTSGTCVRSLANYPRLVATAIKASSFTDVSCAGATTANVLRTTPIPGTTEPVTAQLDAVTDSTQVVTVGIGGNDSALFSKLSTACTTDAAACDAYLDDSLPGVLRTTSGQVTKVLDAIAAKAPKATVVLVGYLRVAPSTKGCEQLGGSALDAKGVAAGERAIDAMMAAAATKAGATYVSMNAVAKGHDACAGTQAWTNGLVPALGDGASLHPRKIGMEAVARRVESALGS